MHKLRDRNKKKEGKGTKAGGGKGERNEVREGLAAWISGSRHWPPSLLAWVRSSGPTQ